MYHEYRNPDGTVSHRHYNSQHLSAPKPQKIASTRIDIYSAIAFLQVVNGEDWTTRFLRNNGNAWKEAQTIRTAARSRAA